MTSVLRASVSSRRPRKSAKNRIAAPTANPAETFTHDADGNLIQDATRTYTWNGENRLIVAEPTSPIDGDKKLEFVYDYMGRRARKQVFTRTAGVWSLTGDQRFVYDNWNVVMVLDGLAGNATTTKYTWGLDLSDTLHGAGGVSGLIAIRDETPATPKDYFVLHDANGNVTQLIDAADLSLAAHYEYDPYGNTVVANGPYAAANPFRFSTKWRDDETGLYYYGYRHYNPTLGRWMSRDPLGEQRDLVLYGALGNTPINAIDPLERV